MINDKEFGHIDNMDSKMNQPDDPNDAPDIDLDDFLR